MCDTVRRRETLEISQEVLFRGDIFTNLNYGGGIRPYKKLKVCIYVFIT